MPLAVAVPKWFVAGLAYGQAKCGWAFDPAKNGFKKLMWLAGPLAHLNMAGWAFGCQNKKVAAHMCAACGRFSDPAPPMMEIKLILCSRPKRRKTKKTPVTW